MNIYWTEATSVSWLSIDNFFIKKKDNVKMWVSIMNDKSGFR